jgi:hypothetical protein
MIMQNLIVAAIVSYACWYVLRRYLPKSVKRRMATAVAAWCRDRGWHGVAARMQAAEQAPATGCDSCSACAGAEEKGKDKKGNQAVQKISVDSLKRSLRR